MSQARFSFEVQHTDRHCPARRSTLTAPHGRVAMPAFMPVGTAATVKGITVDQLHATGSEMVLANTYHLTLRPGEDVVGGLGGLHAFMGWHGPILTDSGGFQLFSLAERTRVTDQAAHFQSHIDGRHCTLSPEAAIRIQEDLGSDVAMVLDHVVPLPNEPSVVRDAMQRTVRWAERSRAAATRADQIQCAIVQGGLDAALRIQCAEQLVALDFPAYAVGGLSVGEENEAMLRILDATVPALPADKPRYLMGVGRPQDLIEGVRRGIDLFDCVMPTRNGRNSLAFTAAGPMRLRNHKYRRDGRPIEADCPCPTCRHSRAYLRHLFAAGEMLGPILLSIHNVTHYQRLLDEARRAIVADRFEVFAATRLAGYEGLGGGGSGWKNGERGA